MSLAKIVVSGRIVRAPEKRFTPSTNVAVTEFAVAVEGAVRPDGNTDSNPVKVITWRELAERCSHELHKGDLVVVDGRLQINSYTTSEGQRRREAEIEAIAVENITAGAAATGTASVFETTDEQLVATTTTRSTMTQSEASDNIFASEDEIPF